LPVVDVTTSVTRLARVPPHVVRGSGGVRVRMVNGIVEIVCVVQQDG